MATRAKPRLREFREERGWTQRETAEHLQRLAWVRHRDHVGVNADMVAKWERGAKGVSAYYCQLFAVLFGVEAAALGLGAVRASEVSRRLEAHADEVGRLVDRLAPRGDVLRTRISAVLEDQVTRRTTLLDVMGWPLMGDDEAGPMTSTASDELCGRLQDEYHSAPSSVLFTAVLACIDALAEGQQTSTTSGERSRLAADRARMATLAGRLAFFDLDDPVAARSYYTAAAEAAREASDPRQTAAALGHLAFVPAAEGAPRAAMDYLESARRELAGHPHDAVAAWLEAIESELRVGVGDDTGALAAIDRARATLDDGALELAPVWFDYFDATRLAGFAGYANLHAGRYDAARDELEAALRLPLHAAKQRSVLLTDLATVHLHAGDLDEACHVAGTAVDELARAGYATGSRRVRSFLRLVRPHGDVPAVRHLNERVSSLN